ncbi:sulfite exporter TauE/SafE family protein [Micromonospora sp. CPCC 206061]|uniref:sulfite exporter TauE/SafE family protein n=1 Tax=Micromonospora sp. CPCC 206061 TaxID=3122410 RepID=UPI002FF356C5
MNLGAVLVTGLFAGGVSCAAVQGGLLAGLITRQRAAAPAPPKRAVVKAGAAARRHGTASSGPHAKGNRAPAGEPVQASASRRARVADDLAPVGAFLAGKLASHALLGALLGAVGAAVQISPAVRVWTQLAAGALIIVFGLAQLGVGPFKRLAIEPPAAWSRFVRGRARSRGAFAPAVLGFFTFLVPCGITLSVEALALSSGSALSGAAVMAVFVVGTGPLFTVLGYAARKAATAWRGRLAVATGLVVLAMGVYTFNGGLTLADSPLAASNLPQTLGFQPPPAVADPAVVHQDTAGRQEVIVTARSDSYSPENIAAKAGVPTTLVLRSVDNNGCTRAFVIPSLDKQWTLPQNGDTSIDLGVLKPGKLSYTCAMGMYGGQLTITA